MSKIKDYLLEREKEFGRLLNRVKFDGAFVFEPPGVEDKERDAIKSFQAETVRGVLERVRENVKKMWDYPCGCTARQEFCVHDYNTMHAVLSLLDTNEK